jgi:hypothetical protein
MNYALFFFGPNSFDVIPTERGAGIIECIHDSKLATVLVAPQKYVDKYLRLNPDSDNYLALRNHSRTAVAKRDAILSFYGGTYAHTYRK